MKHSSRITKSVCRMAQLRRTQERFNKVYTTTVRVQLERSSFFLEAFLPSKQLHLTTKVIKKRKVAQGSTKRDF